MDWVLFLTFKNLKELVQARIVKVLDHKLLLSKAYLDANMKEFSSDELLVFEVEPTAENILIFARN